MLDQPVVLGVEHVVDGGEHDVFIGPAIAGDEMLIEQFVVIFGIPAGHGIDHDGVSRHHVGIRNKHAECIYDRCRIMGDVEDQGRAGTQGGGGVNGSRQIAFDQATRGYDLR